MFFNMFFKKENFRRFEKKKYPLETIFKFIQSRTQGKFGFKTRYERKLVIEPSEVTNVSFHSAARAGRGKEEKGGISNVACPLKDRAEALRYNAENLTRGRVKECAV